MSTFVSNAIVVVRSTLPLIYNPVGIRVGVKKLLVLPLTQDILTLFAKVFAGTNNNPS